MKDGCIYCAAKAVRWCDFIIGFTDPDGDGLFSAPSWLGGAAGQDSELLRCDAPLCIEHTNARGWVHFKAPKPIGGFESIDWCKGHTEEEHMRPITRGDAEQVRYRHRCIARPGLVLLRPTSGGQRGLFD